MNVLFITSNRLGDAVLSTGLLDHLIRHESELCVTVACGAVPAPLFRETPGVERVIVLEKRAMAGHWLALWHQTVGTAWDLVIDLRATAVSWLLRAGSRRILDTGMSGDSTHRASQLAAVLGLGEVPAPRIWLGGEQRAEASELLPADRPVLAVGPTANWGGKQWRPEYFAEAIVRLTGPGAVLGGANVAVFGAPDERAMAEPVLESIPEERRVDLVGAADLLVTAACLERAHLYIGNDSGLMHLAAAVGVPTLGLFGPSRDVHYAPWGDHCAFVRTTQSYEEIVGSPEYDYRRHDTWMDTLSVDAVEQAATALLAAHPRHSSLGWDGAMTLSALVVAHNEEHQLGECLERLAFADEVVVVLDRCTDGSAEIARRFTDRIIEGAWPLEGDRHNTGIDACQGPWILEVDSDERVPEAMGREILETVANAEPGYFLIPFDNYIGDRLVRYGWGAAWGVSAAPRLFTKDAKRWGNQRVHPSLELKGAKRTLKTPMIHLVDRNISDMLQRLDRYTTARALDLRDSGDIGSLPANIRRMFSRFWKCYVARKGYREGAWGVLIALMAALYPILSHLKARLEEE